jgi:hypothetical protein
MMLVPFSVNTGFNPLRQRLRGECPAWAFSLESRRLSNGVYFHLIKKDDLVF